MGRPRKEGEGDTVQAVTRALSLLEVIAEKKGIAFRNWLKKPS